ncbi:hypothetical protein G6O69_31810 [Pseudenhygromyxa sp. WMMC2535]|uniref:hypothetical protein n=1 Tax=Pseudenhygromyxa sp. WMMC2535 TaxID=2712867 RepID=UPI0015542DAE|nr:hypothetical protein [Pseudenhygromyxa sp. WMMC2535]NVB42453.1 hypothetical protein [Pseudenhygromyxa sp. WMMC2535]
MTSRLSRALLTLTAISTLLALPAQAQASNYPPDFDICSEYDYAYSGPFELILDPVRDHVTKLTVAYRGYLRDYYADEDINIYISLNGNDAFIGASAGSNGDAYILLNSGPRNCVWCPTGGSPSDADICDEIDVPGDSPDSSGIWHCDDPTDIENHLFYWAYDEFGNRNDWDIQVAAEANGYWDSNLGANYSAYFDADAVCY